MAFVSLPHGRGYLEISGLPRPRLAVMIGAAAGLALAGAAAFGVAFLLEYRRDAAAAAQFGVDAETAALAAAGALADGEEAPAAERIGTRLLAEAGSEHANVRVEDYGGFAAATVDYQTPVGPISRAFGAQPRTQRRTARVQRLPGAARAFLTLDEATLPVDCAADPARWRLALKDAGFSLSLRCAHSANWGRDGISAFEISLGGHRVVVAASEPTLKPRPDGGLDLDYGGRAWRGEVEIDGTPHPAVRGVTRYLDGGVRVETTNLDFPGEGGNRVDIVAGEGSTSYRLSLSFDAFQFGAMTIEATDPGRCSKPEGFLAERLPTSAAGGCETAPLDPG